MSEWTFDVSGYDALPPITEPIDEVWSAPAGWRFLWIAVPRDGS